MTAVPDYNALALTYLEDTPLSSLGDGDALRHENLAEQIANTVRVCPLPFTIGLDGEWGSGKTSVAKHTQALLKKSAPEAFASVYFDAWKYERDSLRRQFLLHSHSELVGQKLLSDSDLLPEDLYQSTTIQAPPRLDLHSINPFQERPDGGRPEVVVWLRAGLLVFGAVLMILAVVLAALGHIEWTLFAGVLSGSAFSVVAGLLPRIFLIRTPVAQIPPLTSAEQFERVFKEWLAKPTLQSRKLVIVVDNLDRCEQDEIVDLLGDIKTFLEPENSKVVFLLPVDESAVRRALEARYDKRMAAEYLRKFFNTTFRMPSPLWAETRNFATQKLRDTGLVRASSAPAQEAERVVAVMMAAYPNNPRRVIQFLNRLLSHWQQIHSTALALRHPEIARELGATAKALAIRERWPDFAQSIEALPGKLAEAENKAEARREIENNPDLAGFLRATSTISLTRPRLFLTGKADVFEVQLPDADLLRLHLLGLGNDTLSDLLNTGEWQNDEIRYHTLDLIEAEAQAHVDASRQESLGLLISIAASTLRTFDDESRDRLRLLLLRFAQPIPSFLCGYGPEVVKLVGDTVVPVTRQADLSLLLSVVKSATLEQRVEIVRHIISDESLDAIHGDLMELPEVIQEPEVLEALFLHDDKITRAWDDQKAEDCLRFSCSAVQPLTSGRFEAMIAIGDEAAVRGSSVAFLGLTLLQRADTAERPIVFGWAALSPVLRGRHEPRDLGKDLSKVVAEADRLLESQDLIDVNHAALMTSLFIFADENGKRATRERLGRFLARPFSPNFQELAEPWFPNLRQVIADPCNLLFESIQGTRAPDLDELRTRLRVARHHADDWQSVATYTRALLGQGQQRKASLMVSMVIDLEGDSPKEFVEAIWPVSLALSRTAVYNEELAGMMATMINRALPANRELMTKQRSELRQLLLQQIFQNQQHAFSQYQRLAITKQERAEDQAYIIKVLETGTAPLNQESWLAVKVAIDGPAKAARTELFGHLVSLATGHTFWALGLKSLDDVSWSPGPRIVEAAIEKLIATVLAQSSVDSRRASATFHTAFRLAKSATRPGSLESIRRAAAVVPRDNVVTQKELDDLLSD